jgi:aspartyl-tRNA(Asn)/glutamyl-tRNA(Gln) amidotransferase subunit A
MRLDELSLCDAASAIRAGTLSPVEYLHSLLERIGAVETRVRAWATVDRSSALVEAEKCEAEARTGSFRGPLHGIPIGIKDIFYTRNLRTTMGSSIFENFVPDHDATVVAQLRQSGAIVLGKTVTTPFAYLDPGPTRNPWNLAHTPGGSSSGSAAAVASGMCPAAVGSQTVGSIARPAAFNGLAALVPTQARISRAAVFPLAWSLDHVGVIARTVADLDLMGRAMSEGPLDMVSEDRPFRIGMIRDFFYENASPEAQSLSDRFANRLADSGFHVEEARLPGIFALAGPALRTIVRCETASVHERMLPEHLDAYGEKLRALIETGMLVEAGDYLRARRIRRQYQREMVKLFGRFDALMTPAARGTAPEGINSTGDAVMNGPWTLADFPTVTLPHALGSNGLPLGIQLSGPPLQEAKILKVARAVEAVADFKARPKL